MKLCRNWLVSLSVCSHLVSPIRPVYPLAAMPEKSRNEDLHIPSLRALTGLSKESSTVGLSREWCTVWNLLNLIPEHYVQKIWMLLSNIRELHMASLYQGQLDESEAATRLDADLAGTVGCYCIVMQKQFISAAYKVSHWLVKVVILVYLSYCTWSETIAHEKRCFRGVALRYGAAHGVPPVIMRCRHKKNSQEYSVQCKCFHDIPKSCFCVWVQDS